MVATGFAGRPREPLEGSERGFLLETWVLHELRASMAFHNTGGQLHYWRTPHGSEVDFIWTRAKRAVGIEVKASERWRSEFGAPLKGLLEEGIVQTDRLRRLHRQGRTEGRSAARVAYAAILQGTGCGGSISVRN